MGEGRLGITESLAKKYNNISNKNLYPAILILFSRNICDIFFLFVFFPIVGVGVALHEMPVKFWKVIGVRLGGGRRTEVLGHDNSMQETINLFSSILILFQTNTIVTTDLE